MICLLVTCSAFGACFGILIYRLIRGKNVTTEFIITLLNLWLTYQQYEWFMTNITYVSEVSK